MNDQAPEPTIQEAATLALPVIAFEVKDGEHRYRAVLTDRKMLDKDNKPMVSVEIEFLQRDQMGQEFWGFSSQLNLQRLLLKFWQQGGAMTPAISQVIDIALKPKKY